MAYNDLNSLVVRGALQNVSMQYRNTEFVADQIFPIINGLNKKAKVAKNQKGAWFRDDAQVRAPGAPAVIGEIHTTTSNLDPVNYAFAGMVTKEERLAANEPGSLPIQPDIDTLEYIANVLDMKREVRTRDVIHAADWSGVGAGGEDAEGHWGDSTVGNDTFLADIDNGMTTILKNTGKVANYLFLDWMAWGGIKLAPALLALMNPRQLSADALVTLDSLKSLINIPNIIIGSAIKSTAEEVADGSDFDPTWLWGTTGADNAKGVGFLFHRPDSAGLKKASAGYQYRLKKENGESRISTTWPEPARHSDMYDTEEDVDITAVGLDLGYMWMDTRTT